MFDAYIRRAQEDGKTIFNDFVVTDQEKEALKAQGKDVESLESLKRVLTPLEYAGQYLNDPIDDDIIEFKRDWLIRFERTPDLAAKLRTGTVVISVDPAFRLKQTNDFSGIVVSNRTPDSLVYILEAKQLKVNPATLVEEICRLADIYHPRKVLIESVAAQVLLLNLLQNKMRETGKFFVLEEVKPNTQETKAMRVRGLIRYYANGQILHAPGLADLESQLLEFPRGIHDDIIDALAYLQYEWKSNIPPKKRKTEGAYTWDWWSKRPQMGKAQPANLKALFGDLLG